MNQHANIIGQCHCGKVQITVAENPNFINDCNCSLCTSAGALWGYYIPSNVKITGLTQNYKRTDKPSHAVQIHFCATCGSTTHWKLTDCYIATSGKNNLMGINMRLFNMDKLSGVELRFPDGKNWTGQGEYKYRKASLRLP